MDIAKNSIKAFSIKIFGALLFTAYSIFLARILSQDDYGTVMFAIAVATALGPICLLGFDRTTTKFAAVYYAENQVPQLRGLLTRGRRIGLGFGFALLLLAAGLVMLGFLSFAESKHKAVLLALGILPLWAWVLLHREFQRGLKLLVPALMGFQILRPALAMAFTALIFLIGPVNAVSALACLGGALAVAIILDTRRIKAVLGPPDGRLVYETDKWFHTAKPLLFSMFMYTIVTRADMLMVGSLLGMEEAARYSVASRLASFPDFILEAIRVVMAPLIAERFHKNELGQMQQRVTKASQMVFLAVAPFAIAFMSFPRFFLGLFGAPYQSADMILVLLIVGQCVNAFSGTVGVLMTMTNLQREHARIVSVSAVVMLALGYLLIKIIGAEGAALATAITMSLANVWMVIVVKKELGIMSYIRINRPVAGPHDVFVRSEEVA
ncbi:MAG: oligosaccharide flippase family protein [candidate division KSB1 bacterium]|nr:oligosaccharide flippase family protein [candidate division KSB1 bacterium]MDZ7367392.1 oligosaccharide flippase family protein [candidate division KSB1 bacterium]MDZ7405273.1 oligosaccharide flippase family protein [candidate division KSB1 bacterium]